MKSKDWYFERIEEEFGYPARDVIRGMYDSGTALRIIAGALEIPPSTLMGWVRRWGWTRPDIGKERGEPVLRRIWDEFGHDPIRLVCSDRKMGLKYRELKEKYGISNPTIAKWLRRGAPELVGNKERPVTVSPAEISEKERERRRQRCRERNHQMKKANQGWFATRHMFFGCR